MLIDTRTIFGIGSGRADIYEYADRFTVEVVCNKGVSTWSVERDGQADADGREVASVEAWFTFMHPFARADRLSIPGSDDQRAQPYTDDEYALAEALAEATADDSDTIPA